MAATVKGGFFAQYSGTYTPSYTGKSPLRRAVAKAFNKLKVLRELAHELNGVAPGAAASATHTRIVASEELGGRRVIETVTDVSRITTAADVTAIDADVLTYENYDNTPPINLDRNPLGTR